MTEPLDADWSNPPHVEEGAAEDFKALAGEEPYEGMGLPEAKKRFAENGLDWDTLSPDEFKEVITGLKQSDDYSQAVGGACFVFCDQKIPEKHRLGWVIAVMAARDVHEDD